jgi:hypothetical protein
MVVFRHGVLSAGVLLWRRSFWMHFLFFAAMVPAVANTNSWLKPTSGYWEEQAHWSLGVLPDATQTVLFTNAGWKALAIGAGTAQNFPQSMRVQSLRLAGPIDSYNVLLMNFSGFERPLQTGSLTIGMNSAVVMQSSSLEVLSSPETTGQLTLEGEFSQGDFSQVTVQGLLTLRSGSYSLTNGTLTAFLLDGFGGRFVQYGGTSQVNRMQLHQAGEYHLHDGQVFATSLMLAGISGSFYQYGGGVTADVDVGNDSPGSPGRYILSGGQLTGRMSIPAFRGNGRVEQSGGTNFAVSLTIGNASRFGGVGHYVLSNGVVTVSSSTTIRGFGAVEQWNGQHTSASNLVMHGVDLFPYGVASADYLLRGGLLSAPALTISIAAFEQEGGSNLIAGDVVIGPAGQSTLYTLNGGFLSVSNMILNGSVESGFEQAGGTNIILGELRVADQGQGFRGYILNGGSLSVSDITISNGGAFHHFAGNLSHSGVITLAGGRWLAQPGEQALGPLRLATGEPPSSRIEFPTQPSVLRLANSSGEAWSPNASLHIHNWRGSGAAGGGTQLFVGSDANGLTPQQLALIQFDLAGGLHPARLLATGEVVPQLPMLTYSRSGNTLTLSWELGWILQSSTNVAGPYEDVPAATSPYTVSLSNPSEFFRLRQ